MEKISLNDNKEVEGVAVESDAEQNHNEQTEEATSMTEAEISQEASRNFRQNFRTAAEGLFVQKFEDMKPGEEALPPAAREQ